MQSERTVMAETSSIEFVDGVTFNFENVQVNSSYRAKASQQILAYSNLANGSRVPYVLYEPCENGSLVFIDAPLTQDISNTTLYRELLQYTFTTVKKLLPSQTVPSKSLKLPYANDLFKYIIPHILGLRYLEELHNTIICYNNVQIHGNVTVTSDNILLFNEDFPIEKMILHSPAGDYIIENSTLHNLIVRGLGTLSSTMSNIEIINNPSGSYAVLTISNSESSELSFSNAELTFEAETNGENNNNHFLNSSVTILFNNALKMLVKWPTITVEGVVKSTLQGVILNKNLFFYVPQEYSNTTLTGSFGLEILYSSGFIYGKVTKISNITAVGEREIAREIA
jgi:hypothetical protein